MNGYMYLRPKETKTLISSMLKKVPKEADSRNPYVILSPREREVLRFLVRGYSLAETAKALTVSIKTVDTHKTRMMNKLNISKKSELIEYALEYRLLNDGQV
ncbi:oxygen regulatory protein NreC [Paenibacillus larvae subsp. larvae]|nr:oxygen regulatory protein NreC [Paenibacillus larvae subsp. larvae]AVF29489.1 oxygen regulatory protein NreC [Paenibacillus larvae subsp. larvae]